MTYKQFEHCHLKGWKIGKILEYLNVDDSETDQVRDLFKRYFSIKMGIIRDGKKGGDM